MSKLVVANRVPREYNAAVFQEILRLLEQQVNPLTEGRISARHGAMAAAPTTGEWVKGDYVDNSAPAVVVDSVADYVIVGWICTASGTPGTWKERRVLVEGITTGAASAATQAEQETGSSTSVFVSPGRQQYHQSAAKAWINFDGTGTPTARASYNVSSITDNGVGDYTLNFTTAFSSANYGYVVTAGDQNVTLGIAQVSDTTPTASAFRFITVSNTATPQDSAWIGAAFYGDQ